jgi:hypothetical protein
LGLPDSFTEELKSKDIFSLEALMEAGLVGLAGQIAR